MRGPPAQRTCAGYLRTTAARGLGHLEGCDDLQQGARLFLQRTRGRCCFLDQGRVLLRDLVHLRDGLVNLFNALSLLLACRADLTQDVSHAAYARDDLFHRPARLGHLMAT